MLRDQMQAGCGRGRLEEESGASRDQASWAQNEWERQAWGISSDESRLPRGVSAAVGESGPCRRFAGLAASTSPPNGAGSRLWRTAPA